VSTAVAEAWSRVGQWLEANAPEILENLAGPASDAEFAAREKALGVSLPHDFKTAYRIHNGQHRDIPGLTEFGQLLPLKRVVEEWKVWKELLDTGDFAGATSEPNPGIRNVWWSPRWIPFTSDGGGNHLCIDLEPASGGNVGQVITMWHDDPHRELVAPNFGAWLAQLAADLETGKLVYSEGHGGVIRADFA